MFGLCHPHRPPSTVTSVSSDTANSNVSTDTESTAPAVPGTRTSGTTTRPAKNVTTPMGTLIRKIHRQSKPMSSPPSVGPIDAATAATPAHVPTTRLCSRCSKRGQSNPIDVGTIIAAPMPCSIRPATATHSAGAHAHATDATVKTATPAKKTRRRPKWSANRPAGTNSVAKTIAYPVTIHDIDDSDAPEKLRAIEGKAMLTMNKSSWAMNAPAANTARTSQRLRTTTPTGYGAAARCPALRDQYHGGSVPPPSSTI